MIDKKIKTDILTYLTALEKEKRIKILYACESGSRAWGFPSTDSDYDVRFFYMHAPEWYFSILDRKDTMENVGPVLDFNGWELRKTLRLFMKSNASLIEKVQSPIVYKENGVFREALNGLMQDYFNPKACMFHYYSLAHNFYEEALQKEKVKLKKYFYAIRSILAARWIRIHKEVAPMEFSTLRSVMEDKNWNDLVEDWLEKKISGTEGTLVNPSKLINNFIKIELEEGKIYADALPRYEKTPPEALDELYRKLIKNE